MRNIPRENEISNRITNGFQAESRIPWQVTITIGNALCGGTILNEDTILSAAHCFLRRPKGIYVPVGISNTECINTLWKDFS